VRGAITFAECRASGDCLSRINVTTSRSPDRHRHLRCGTRRAFALRLNPRDDAPWARARSRLPHSQWSGGWVRTRPDRFRRRASVPGRDRRNLKTTLTPDAPSLPDCESTSGPAVLTWLGRFGANPDWLLEGCSEGRCWRCSNVRIDAHWIDHSHGSPRS
jgi:hypothetical protein